MTTPVDLAETLRQIEAARDQAHDNIALVQAQLLQAQDAASAAATDRAAAEAAVQQAITADTSVGARVFAGDQMIHGDSGARNILGSVNGSSDRPVILRRVGPIVYLNAEQVTCGPSVGSVLLTIPGGFRPAWFIYGQSYQYWTTEVSKKLRIRNDGALLLYPMVEGEVTNLTLSWQTSNPWPTSLPGTAA